MRRRLRKFFICSSIYSSAFPYLLMGAILIIAATSVGCAPVDQPMTTAVQPPTDGIPTQTFSITQITPSTPHRKPSATSPNVAKTAAEQLTTSSATATPPVPGKKAIQNTQTSVKSLGLPTTTLDLGSDGWMKLPVLPEIDEEIKKIYARGIESGNNPRAFSKIGDCGSTPAWFLGDFDRGPRYYRLGIYSNLSEIIDYYHGSFDRTSLAARSGFNASALFVPLWADTTYCQQNEPPLACEYRVHKPVIAFIMLGANDVWRPQEFEPQMRKIVEFSIQNGVIPILATKADNQEGDGSLNATIAKLAFEYRVPLWNFWRAANVLPNQGLQEDNVHLSWGANHFDDPEALKSAWTQRNLTALQVLNKIWIVLSNSR